MSRRWEKSAAEGQVKPELEDDAEEENTVDDLRSMLNKLEAQINQKTGGARVRKGL